MSCGTPDGDALLEDALAGVADFPGDLHAGGFDDLPGGFDAFRPDAVAGDERDERVPLGVLHKLGHCVLEGEFRGCFCIAAVLKW